MKVVVAHNFYQSKVPSGENLVVEEECAALERAGVDVHRFWRYSERISESWGSKIDASLGSAIAPLAVRDFAETIKRVKPDVVHVHNLYPLVSPQVVRIAHQHGVGVIQTVHNYRHSCVRGVHFRKGEPCFDCLNRRLSIPAVQHACYRGSRAQSIAMVAGGFIQRGVWQHVDRYLALSRAQAKLLIRGGLPGDRIFVKPNFVPDPMTESPPGPKVAYVGRLDATKGVHLLLEAWQSLAVANKTSLVFLGEGPERERLELASAGDPTVQVLGAVAPSKVWPTLTGCGVLVSPSAWAEPFARTIVEAMANGRAVVATRVGAAEELIPPRVGNLCLPNPSSLARAIAELLRDPALADRQQAARNHYLRHYSTDVVLKQLLHHYEVVARAA